MKRKSVASWLWVTLFQGEPGPVVMRATTILVLFINGRYMPSKEALRRSEFLLPLDAESLQLWGNLLLLATASAASAADNAAVK